ncbi:MAG: outer membrane beta-barrel protein [Saprospiraceae bacterium]
MENDKAFDNFIRQGLEKHPLPKNSGDWGKMESRILADEQLQNNEFDDFVRNDVGNIKTQLPNSDWALMESMILSDGIFSSEIFDEQILEDVQQTELQSPQGNWSLMESMITADELILNQEFDSSFKEDLQNIDANIPSNWDKMESMLEKDDQHGRELLYAKTIELALIVLAVVMLFRFFPDTNGISEAKFPTGETANLQESISDQNKNSSNKNEAKIAEVKISHEKITTHNNTSNELKETTNIINNTSVDSQINSHSGNNVDGNPIGKNTNPSSLDSEYNPILQTSNQKSSDNNNNNNIVTKIIDNAKEPISDSSKKTILSKDEADFSLLELNALVSPLAEEVSSDQKEDNSIQIEALPKFRAGVYVGANRNHIMSPYDEEAEVSYEQNTYGFSVGAEATFVKHNMEFSTGASYTQMKYLPKTILEVTGNTARGYEADKLDLMSYHIVSVPLSMRYYFSKYASWRFYAKTGVTMNSIFMNTNQINQYTLPSFRDLDALLEKGPESIRMEKQGLWNGQSFGDSFFLKANLGMGVERNFAKRYHIFVEPNFNYHIYSIGEGFGPNKDRINHVSLNMGVRMGF